MRPLLSGLICVLLISCEKSEDAPVDTSSLAAPAAAQVGPTKEEAFAAAYPHPEVAVTGEDGTIDFRFSPAALYEVAPNTYALVSEGTNLDCDAHACSGAVSVTYLQRRPNLGKVAESSVFYGGGYGSPPAFALGPKLNSSPLLVLDHGWSGQGVTLSSTELILLAPEFSGLRSVAMIAMDYDDSGVSEDRNCHIEGKIVPGAPDGTFAVQYAGSFNRTVTYTWNTAEWRPGEEIGDLYELCPAPERSYTVDDSTPEGAE